MITKSRTMYILGALALITGVLFLLQKQRVVEIPEEVAKITQEGMLAPLAFPDNTLDISDWQTYRDEKFGFEVRYPKNWGVEFSDTSMGGGTGEPAQSGYWGQLTFFPLNVRDIKSSIDLFTIYNLSLSDQIKRIVNSELVSMEIKNRFKINNTTGVNYGLADEHPNGGLKVNNYIIAGDGVTYIFYGNMPNSDKYIPELQQMLLSFKLTK